MGSVDSKFDINWPLQEQREWFLQRAVSPDRKYRAWSRRKIHQYGYRYIYAVSKMRVFRD